MLYAGVIIVKNNVKNSKKLNKWLLIKIVFAKDFTICDTS